MLDNASMIPAVAGAAAVTLCTVPSIVAVVRQVLARTPRDDNLYEDADGKATPESVAAFSNKLPKAALLLAASAGAAVSLASYILTLQKDRSLFAEGGLATAAWFLILLQAVAVTAVRHPPLAYLLGLFVFVSGLIQAIVLGTIEFEVIEDLYHSDTTLFALRISEFVAVVAVAAFSVLLPRRPDVFHNGQPVDRMQTTTAYGRLTFSWAAPLMSLSTKKNNLDLDDLPRPDGHTRAGDVSAYWKAKGYSNHRLWLSIAKFQAWEFSLQWALTCVSSLLSFAPQWVVLHLLRILETRAPGEPLGLNVWIWVLWLGLSIIAQSLVESYVFWLSWAQIAFPVRSALSSLIFEKSMRRKDVKQSRQKAKPSEGDAADAQAEPGKPAAEGASKAAAGEDDEDESAQKSKQGTVNLIGVDSKRASDFCSYQNFFPGSVCSLAFSLAFLISLIGWLPLLAGFGAMALTTPFNIYFSRRYANAQEALMKLRDEKLGVITEALQGMRQIKFSALEPQWEAKIAEVRNRELKSIRSVFVFDSVLIACWITNPIALSAISLAVYAWIHGELAPSVAFVSLGVFRSMETTLSVVPELTTDLLDALVSLRRIEDYLNSPDIVEISQDGDAVSFDSASIAWPTDDDNLAESERYVLRDVSLTFPPGELSIISGKTGTGKSMMLAAILGEVDLLSGSLTVPRGPSLQDRHDDKATPANWILPKSIAYVAQIPWIENATIRENILFGLPFDPERYRKTVDVCALTKDLEMLTDGEDTEIGANGINLSGGQKWRITLARAVYSRAGILVMDDIFSAVDAHVGRHIYEKCINGELCAGRTRILVTHHVALCAPHTKFLVELADGRVLHSGLISELAEEGILEAIKSNEQSTEEIAEDEAAEATAVNSDNNSTDQAIETDNEQDGAGSSSNTALAKGSSGASQAAPKKEARKFVEDEKREEGAVRRHVYAAYLNASGGWWFWSIIVVWFIGVQLLNIGRSWWLRLWTGQYDEASHSVPTNQSLSVFGAGYSSYGGYQQQLWMGNAGHDSVTAAVAGPAATASGRSTSYYITVYVALSMAMAILGSLRFAFMFLGSVRASRTLFEKMNFIILRAPLRWIDTVPVGRILNRFTADFNIIDSQLANNLGFGFNSFIRLVGVVLSGFFVSPFIVLISLGLIAICSYFGHVYLASARPAKRLESTVKSPVFEQFGAALSGVVTIRGFGKSQVYIDRMFRKLDDWSCTSWYMWLFNRWVGWRMSLVGSFFAVIVATILLTSNAVDSALAGFALSFALEFASAVMWTVRMYSNIELQMNAAERIVEYTELPTEDLGGVSPPAAWPTEGRVEVNNLVVGYAPDLPPVLKGLTFGVDGRQRVGVVGRTGAGKSSLTLAFFRFLEARSGSIHIDGIDISKIKLSDLRSRLAIIPQDPVLFSGTIRSNLDPFDEHSDEELLDCLDRVHLRTPPSGQATPVPGPSGSEPSTALAKNTNVFNDLTSPISEGGLNLSQGQRQLLCLARAIVRRPRVMVLDEATSAVDMHTDALIQRSIREEFTSSTLLVIAHRLSTIADFDRILVLKDGAVAEFGTPRELWEKGPEEGIFRSMCDESGEREKLEQAVLGVASSSK